MNELITQTNDLLNNQGFEYAFCGGYAVDLFLGCESRPHGDIDILAYWKDRNKIIEYMWTQGYCVYEMLGEGKAHHITDINNQFIKKRNIFCIKEDCDFIRLTETTEQDVYIVEIIPAIQRKLNFIEFLFNDRTDEQFLYARNHNIKRALNKSILYADNIPYLAPEICLLYKSTDTERKGYQQDYDLSIQKMNNKQRKWLREALSELFPNGHKWIGEL